MIQLAITAFYDFRPARRSGTPRGTNATDPAAIYPEIYLIHVGGRHGDHSALDFWPSRKEVFLPPDPRIVLDAINDRAISRLLVPDGDPETVEHEFKEPAAARDRISSALAYDPSGRVRRPEIEIRGLDSRTEANARLILDPARRYSGAGSSSDAAHPDPVLRARSWALQTEARRLEAASGLRLAQGRRKAIRIDGLATETYRRISVGEALSMLVP
jgi:hypothetical protein